MSDTETKAPTRKTAVEKAEAAKDGAARALANARAGVGSKAGSGTIQNDYFTPEQVDKMTPEEVEKNLDKIHKSMKRW